MTYTIVKKLNYKDEVIEKKNLVDRISLQIEKKMEELSLVRDDISPKYVFSLGGDGTMMHSMHEYFYKESIIVGINSGNIGFLTPFESTELDKVFALINNPNARIEQRSILKYVSANKNDLSINECAITGKGPNDMLDFSIAIEHKNLLSRAGNYKANAVLVSGPCGSTAYNMNVGGAIVDPAVKCIQIMMVAPTTLGARPLIISKNSTIHLSVRKPAKIYSDGILVEELSPGDEIAINLLTVESNLLVPQDWNFYSVLSKKLMWNNGKDV